MHTTDLPALSINKNLPKPPPPFIFLGKLYPAFEIPAMVKLYIGNLDYTTTASRLRREFEAFGRVTDVFLPTEPGAKQHKGFGFVTFADRASAEEGYPRWTRASSMVER